MVVSASRWPRARRARLEVLELAYPGGVFPLKLALQVPQRVTVRSFNIGMVIYFRV